ncbi:hypothetical protein PR202_gb08302 [Eleusine coracana subsp. coracana]|uniref:Uncharacterized protein n=1 Tax=Eleusine coracana subsp. coracana TaxID=191504 RepID=A0AAV5EEA9_ELECO|nr:hypothetical protein PR202_gb08302 [Eleusine coracana subsp. coracana]
MKSFVFGGAQVLHVNLRAGSGAASQFEIFTRRLRYGSAYRKGSGLRHPIQPRVKIPALPSQEGTSSATHLRNLGVFGFVFPNPTIPISSFDDPASHSPALGHQPDLLCPPPVHQQPHVIVIIVLAGLFFNLNLFSGVSDISTILDPRIRILLTSALSLFLPVMCNVFSEAKNAAVARHSSAGDLPLMAGLILAWMLLLVELLCKRVDEIRMRGLSSTDQRAGRVVWLGNLVFFNIKTTRRKVVFSILWNLYATRVVQRIVFIELGKRSHAHGKKCPAHQLIHGTDARTTTSHGHGSWRCGASCSPPLG